MCKNIATFAVFLAASCTVFTGLGRAIADIRGREPEMAAASKWCALLGATVTGTKTAPSAELTPKQFGPVFSFVYGSKPVAELLGQWRQTAKSRTLDTDRTEHIATYTDPKTGLEVRVESTLFRDFPAVEWVLHFKNTGKSDTPILKDILPLDTCLPVAGQSPIVHYARGALCSIDDFAPVDKALGPNALLRLKPAGGRSSSDVMPFFNIDLGTQGMILAIGWTGEWMADFSRSKENDLHLQTGMAQTNLKLHPGEEIRTPRMLALFWQGEPVRGNNLLRRFILAHHRPCPGGKPLVMPVFNVMGGGQTAATHQRFIEQVVKYNLPIELYWIEAEWNGHPWWTNTGNWEPRKELYPQGIRPLSDLLHKSGRKISVWFEPQRVCPGTSWEQFKDRPGWLLRLGNGTPEYKQRNMDWGIPLNDPNWVVLESRRSQIVENEFLWNMGDPAARRFLTDWLSARIDEFGLDWYREDFNLAPLEFWRNADAPDRQGITEIRYVEGLYAMWDELLARHPHLAIDNCASGGRRIDLETIGRSTPLWRSDCSVDALHNQCHTFGLLSWVPLNTPGGGGKFVGSMYDFRSKMTAGLNLGLAGMVDEQSARKIKAMLEQYLSIQKFFYGDYYPLTQYSQSNNVWMAYQLDIPEIGEGLVVVLKRPASPQESKTLHLKALQPNATYQVTNLDTTKSQMLGGDQLMAKGLEGRLTKQPDSALFHYRVAN